MQSISLNGRWAMHKRDSEILYTANVMVQEFLLPLTFEDQVYISQVF